MYYNNFLWKLNFTTIKLYNNHSPISDSIENSTSVEKSLIILKTFLHNNVWKPLYIYWTWTKTGVYFPIYITSTLKLVHPAVCFSFEYRPASLNNEAWKISINTSVYSTPRLRENFLSRFPTLLNFSKNLLEYQNDSLIISHYSLGIIPTLRWKLWQKLGLRENKKPLFSRQNLTHKIKNFP